MPIDGLLKRFCCCDSIGNFGDKDLKVSNMMGIPRDVNPNNIPLLKPSVLYRTTISNTIETIKKP